MFVASGSGEPPRVPIKQEPLTEAEQADADFQEFLAKKVEKLKHFQAVELEVKQYIAQLTTVKYSEGLQSDLRKHLVRVQGLVRILGRAASEAPCKAEFPKLLKAMRTIANVHDSLKACCAKFGMKVQQARNVRRRTSASA